MSNTGICSEKIHNKDKFMEGIKIKQGATKWS